MPVLSRSTCVCVHACVLMLVAAGIPELACSHDKRCTPNLSGGARRSGSRLRPNGSGWLFNVTVVWSRSRVGSWLRVVLCVPSGVRSSACCHTPGCIVASRGCSSVCLRLSARFVPALCMLGPCACLASANFMLWRFVTLLYSSGCNIRSIHAGCGSTCVRLQLWTPACSS